MRSCQSILIEVESSDRSEPLSKNLLLAYSNWQSGKVMFDQNGDRVMDYALVHMASSTANYYSVHLIVHFSSTGNDNVTDIGRVYATQRTDYTVNPYVEIVENRYWGVTGYSVPLDHPLCGFHGELCPTNFGVIVGVPVTFTCVFIGLLLAFCYYYRLKKSEEEIERIVWRIKYEDLVFYKRSQLGISRSTLIMEDVNRSSNSSTAIHSRAQLHEEDIFEGDSTKVANYRGIPVYVKVVNNVAADLTKQHQLQLKTMRAFTHDNITPFIGACIDPPNICILMKHCPRGSLQDILHNSDMTLESEFRLALIRDLISGLEYIHGSPLLFHGRLKSSNCVVDSRWVLQLTDYGLAFLRDNTYQSEDNKFRSLFWTAPEVLRDPNPFLAGSPKGDVYSFSIIMHEILFRCPPFCGKGDPSSIVPRDIVGRVKNGETPPFRPQLPNEDVDYQLVKLMKDCWAEEATERPDMSSINKAFKLISKGKTRNIVDHMLHMMEKYANDLEKIIGERTRQLQEEKRKTDILLYRMLPAMVADSLKTGDPVQPELFRKVAIYFSDIVSFTKMASESSPMEVVDFLNDLWTLFDDIISKYDVYKVETIGDAYMVASGVPTPNEVGYASELASMALDILSSVMTFKIRHKPGRPLQVRIGVHCGPVVTGVVGHTMPRYCLFGDTVNTASRMESTGAPMKIQISEMMHDALKDLRPQFIMQKRGDIDVKGKGLQTTYWLKGRDGYSRKLPEFTED